MISRIERTRRDLARLNLDALLVSNPSNIFYLSNFPGHDSLLLITRSADYIITDFRYEEQARAAGGNFIVAAQPGNRFKKAADIINNTGILKTGFESHHITVKQEDILRAKIAADISPVSDIIEKIRQQKDADEVNRIKASAEIIKRVFKLVKKDIKKNVTEKEIAARIDCLIRTLGAESTAFHTIVLTGENSSLPHGTPSDRCIKSGQPIVLDFGARLNGYSSDLTRTIFVGKICRYINSIYNIVESAQQKAIEKIKPGIKIADIDKAARSYIYNKGFGKYFGHATGHGIGLDVHELPGINSKNHAKLKEAMVFSVEPGIYIPGSFGVRIEDMVVVTNNGCEVITR
jgi:Xaa-Pro aminopeptidase